MTAFALERFELLVQFHCYETLRNIDHSLKVSLVVCARTISSDKLFLNLNELSNFKLSLLSCGIRQKSKKILHSLELECNSAFPENLSKFVIEFETLTQGSPWTHLLVGLPVRFVPLCYR